MERFDISTPMERQRDTDLYSRVSDSLSDRATPLHCERTSTPSQSHRGPGSMPGTPTRFSRVMSPNSQSLVVSPLVASPQSAVVESNSMPAQQTDSPFFARADCELCGRLCIPPIRCSNCHIVGHHTCLRTEDIEGFPFCAGCAPLVRECIARFRNAEQR